MISLRLVPSQIFPFHLEDESQSDQAAVHLCSDSFGSLLLCLYSPCYFWHFYYFGLLLWFYFQLLMLFLKKLKNFILECRSTFEEHIIYNYSLLT